MDITILGDALEALSAGTIIYDQDGRGWELCQVSPIRVVPFRYGADYVKAQAEETDEGEPGDWYVHVWDYDEFGDVG